MADKVNSTDIVDYVRDTYDEEINGLSDSRIEHLPDDFMFEAFAELAIEKNPEYEIDQLSDRWAEENKETGISMYEFAVKVFNELVGEEVYDNMTLDQKDSWIRATVRGITEVGGHV